jgi:FdhE protein
VVAAFERRAERARILAEGADAAGEPLRFGAGLYQAQGRLAAAVEPLHARRPLSGRLSEDAAALAAPAAELLRFTSENGPAGLATAARARADEPESMLSTRLMAYWGADRTDEPDYLSRALLRPYVELLAALGIAPERPHKARSCGFCGGAPWIAARRPSAEADATSRFLGCALCGGEWSIGRICCPSCGEEDPARLPSFSGDRYPGARIEACETCRRYVKSIDLTSDGRAIPEVDDLVSLGLDLWASEQGFERIEPGLAGI